ncbi:MAG: hypothetical protein J7641_19340 [Cyanobacteria bacterium SID2]|nr:hypothetical protein [Cyanobacteria bacterium SID2]MBP0004069.1 hypothetical protein [Cyanobacteria bacterium SBC]
MKLEAPSRPGEWGIKEIEAALSRPLPKSYLQYKPIGGTQIPYIPWYRVNQVLSKYAPGWQGRVTSTVQIGDELVLTYSITIPTADGPVTREATGSEKLECGSYGETAANANPKPFAAVALALDWGCICIGSRTRLLLSSRWTATVLLALDEVVLGFGDGDTQLFGEER